MPGTSINQNFKNMFIVYAKWDGTNNFHAFDLSQGVPVTNIIYASVYSEYDICKLARAKVLLQQTADENKKIHLVFQLRRDSDKKVVWESA